MIVEVMLFVVVIILWLSFRNGKPHGFPPGPAGLPVFGYIPFLFPDPHVKFMNMAKKLGPILGVKLGEKWVVVINDYDILRKAMKEDVFAARPHFPVFLARSDGKKKGIVFADGKEWQEQRRFALRNLKDFGFGKSNMEEFIQVQELVNSLKKDVGKAIDLRFTFNLAVVNSIWIIVTGEPFNYDDPTMKQLFKDFYIAFEGVNITLVPDLYFGWLILMFPRLFRINEFRDVTKRVNKICKENIEEHKKTLDPDSPRDFIDVYLNEINSTTNAESSFYGEKGEDSLILVMSDLFLAGSETTSNTLYWSFLLLITYPEIQKKIQREIDDVVGKSRLPSLQDKANMPFTEAFMTEILRYSSMIVFNIFHAAAEDTIFHGYHIPKGTTIIPNAYAIHYDDTCWDNPEEFSPERFLTPDGKMIKDYALTAFGVGKRQCLGETLARAEFFLFLTGLLQNFNFFCPPGKKYSTKGKVTLSRQAETYNVIFKERDM